MSSSDTTTPRRPPAEKDHECPFCYTKFTSSSLGRHLDLYIKPQNAKAPDGVHDIEKIKNLRGSVTRRQVRNSSGNKPLKRDGSPLSAPLSSRRQSPAADVASGEGRSPVQVWSGGAGLEEAHGEENGRRRPITMQINKLTWEATGVMNDIPAERKDRLPTTSPKQITVAPPHGVLGQGQDPDHAPSEDTKRAIAAERALKEVLDSVRAANMRAHAEPLFNFPFFLSTFPSICLECLSPAPTLGFGSVRPSDEDTTSITWSVELPVEDHLMELRKRIHRRIGEWRRRRNALAQKLDFKSDHPVDRAIHHENDPETIDLNESHQQHLTATYNVWNRRTLPEREQQWSKMLASHLAHEKNQHASTRSRVAELEQEIQGLHNRLRMKGEPSALHLDKKTTEELYSESELGSWDYETILNRWRDRYQYMDNGADPRIPNQPEDLMHTLKDSQTNGLYDGARAVVLFNGDISHDGKMQDMYTPNGTEGNIGETS